jgi:hypothetical protein
MWFCQKDDYFSDATGHTIARGRRDTTLAEV